MDMDPMTRREVDKVEGILVDLVEELRLLALLPEEFTSWVRDETVVAAMGGAGDGFLHLYETQAARAAERARQQHQQQEAAAAAAAERDAHAGHGGGGGLRPESQRPSADHSSRPLGGLEKSAPTGVFHASPSGTADHLSALSSSSSVEWAELLKENSAAEALTASTLAPEDEEERQRAIKAACFVHTAAQYGDPTDFDDNEAIAQVSTFAQLERELLDSATTVGFVDAHDLQTHHLSTRALIDTMRDGGYGTAVEFFLKRFYKTSRSAQAVKGAGNPNAAAPSRAADMAQMHVYGCGMVEESVDHLRDLVETLYHLLHERNQFTVNEDIHRYQLLHDAVNKDQAGTADVQVLNQRFLDVKAARRREVADYDEEIRQLEEELQYVRQAADVELEAFQRVQDNIQNDNRCTLRQQLEAHRSAAEVVAKRLQQAQAKDQDELNALRSQQTKREAAVSGAIADYDTQSAQLEAAMQQFNTEAEEDTGRVVRLETEVQSLQKQREEYAWETKVAERRAEHTSEIRQRQEQDARIIQAYYRAFQARMQAQQTLEKGTKKGKKKGGSKK